MNKTNLEKLYYQTWSEYPDSIHMLKGDGSDRCIYRIINQNRSVIGIIGKNRPENEAFIHFSRHFRTYNLPVPAIYAEDLEKDIYLEEDLGSITFFDWMTDIREKEGFSDRIFEMYKVILQWLPQFQIKAGKTLDYSYCYQHPIFATESMLFDLYYFYERFLAVFYKHKLDRDELEKDFNTLTNHLLEEKPDYFLYRDFQSRNIMIKDEKPYFIDYQSGRRGALQYDVASLLFNAKANIPQNIREELVDFYIESASKWQNIDVSRFFNYFYGFVLIRILQTFGAYGYLSQVKGKKRFLSSVPYAVKNLEIILGKRTILDRLPVLKEIFINMCQDPALREL